MFEGISKIDKKPNHIQNNAEIARTVADDLNLIESKEGKDRFWHASYTGSRGEVVDSILARGLLPKSAMVTRLQGMKIPTMKMRHILQSMATMRLTI